MDIQNLIETIGTSVSRAQQGIEQHSIKRFFDFFEIPNRGMDESDASDDSYRGPQIFEPITTKVALPCSDDIARTAPVEIPLVALAHHRQVHLDKVKVKVKTRLTSDNNGNVMADINAPILNAAIPPEDTETVSGDDIGEIELVFNVTESTEGLSRVVQNISKTI